MSLALRRWFIRNLTLGGSIASSPNTTDKHGSPALFETPGFSFDTARCDTNTFAWKA